MPEEQEIQSPVAQRTQHWIPLAGGLFGAVTLLFLMVLVVLSTMEHEIPPDSRFLVVLVLSLGAALSSAFLGGSAAAHGKLPLPFAREHPIEFSVAGGVAVLVILMLIGQILYLSPFRRPPIDLPRGQALIYDGFSHYSESGFSFRANAIVPWNSPLADVLVSQTRPMGPTVKLFAPYQAPPYDGPHDQYARGGLIQMGELHLDDVAECPTVGYMGHWFDARIGGVYCVRMRDGTHYAKLKISDLLQNQLAFDWVYQPNGSTNFK